MAEVIIEDGYLVCEKCGKKMKEEQFYSHRTGEKDPICKKCLTMHVNNFEPDTFLWILERLDFPYIETEWNVLRDRAFAKDPYSMNGMSVLGKYIAKMRLKKWKDYGWADGARLQAEEDMRRQRSIEAEEAVAIELKNRLEAGLITESEYKTLVSADLQNKDLKAKKPADAVGANNPYREENFLKESDLPDVTEELTAEDKLYLAMKWGRLYKPSEWIELEKDYAAYERSFDLHNTDLQNGTKQLCKLNLKGNQALDCGDLDGYSKLARASSDLRKTLKFTEAQRKEDKTSEFSCYGQIVSFVEMMNDEDYIRPVDLSIDRDIVDVDIRDIKGWTSSLVEDDPTIYKMIEQYIKKRDILEEMEADQDASDGQYQISDKDLADFREHTEKQRREDADDDEDDY